MDITKLDMCNTSKTNGKKRGNPCLAPRRLPLWTKNLRAKEGGKEKPGETALLPTFFPSHGPLRLDTSLSPFALASMQIRSDGTGGGRGNPLFQMKITKTEMLFSLVYLRIVK